MTPDVEPILSPAGAERRDAMLDELLGAMDQHHRRRRAVRGIGAAVAVVALAVVLAVPRAGTIGTRPVGSDPGSITHVSPVNTRIITTAPGILDRYRATEGTGLIEYVDDAGLIDALHAVNRPAGIVRFDGHIRLTAAVTDDELETMTP